MLKKAAAVLFFIVISIINGDAETAEKNINKTPAVSETTENFIPEKTEEEPNVSLGVTGTFGTQFPVLLTGPMKFEPGISYGGGLIVEKMFNSRAGLHTGIYFTESYAPYAMYYSMYPMYAAMRLGSISIPLYFIGSYNKSFFSLQMLAGITLTQVLYALSSPNPARDSITMENLNNISQFMPGPGVGINLKFRLSKYFDFSIGFITTFYFTNFIPHSPGTYSFFYDAKATAGFMFRTNLFPKTQDWRWK